MSAPPPQLSLPVGALREVARSSVELVDVAKELAGLAGTVQDTAVRNRLENPISRLLDHVERISSIVRTVA